MGKIHIGEIHIIGMYLKYIVLIQIKINIFTLYFMHNQFAQLPYNFNQTKERNDK